MDKYATITNRFSTVEFAKQWIETMKETSSLYFEYSDPYNEKQNTNTPIAVDCKTYRYKHNRFYDYDILLEPDGSQYRIIPKGDSGN